MKVGQGAVRGRAEGRRALWDGEEEGGEGEGEEEAVGEGKGCARALSGFL